MKWKRSSSRSSAAENGYREGCGDWVAAIRSDISWTELQILGHLVPFASLGLSAMRCAEVSWTLSLIEHLEPADQAFSVAFSIAFESFLSA